MSATDLTVDDAFVDTTTILVKTLRALGEAGHPDAASRLAAKAWWALRDIRPHEAERINGTMHFLAQLPAEDSALPTEAPTPTAIPKEEA